VTIILPDSEVGDLKLTPDEARMDLAVGLYAGRRVTLGRGAKVAGVTQTEFLHELGRRGVFLHYTVEDAEHDVAVVQELAGDYKAT
jgi:predicted HTH domain antitoxin